MVFWWRRRWYFHGLDLEEKFGSFDPQPDCQYLGNVDAFNAFAIHEDAITAVQIADAPLTVFENHFGVDAADVVVLDAEFAFFCAADAEGLGELKMLVVRRCLVTHL
jgi:hypothetical protein